MVFFRQLTIRGIRRNFKNLLPTRRNPTLASTLPHHHRLGPVGDNILKTVQLFTWLQERWSPSMETIYLNPGLVHHPWCSWRPTDLLRPSFLRLHQTLPSTHHGSRITGNDPARLTDVIDLGRRIVSPRALLSAQFDPNGPVWTRMPQHTPASIISYSIII